MVIVFREILAETSVVFGIVNYELIRGNAAWRFALVLLGVLVTMAAGRIAQFATESAAKRQSQRTGENAMTLILKSLAKPIYVAVFALGLNMCKLFLVFDDTDGIREIVFNGWTKTAQVAGAIAVAYALYRLVDVAEYYLDRIVRKTETTLDDMLVPVIRKSLRITISIIAALFIAESIAGGKITSLIMGAGVGGIAIALAAKDTIANFFGSITIFADRPFQVGELVKIEGHYGAIEEVGFRSTRIRTTQGNLVTIPNNTIANSPVENVGRRPFIRRTSNITITYDSGSSKTQKAVEIIKEVLKDTPEINTDAERPPRVYFSDFNDCSLNVYMSYWVKPADYWLYHEVNERVNFKIMERFETEKIEFAFPSQTVYVKKD